MTITLSSRDPVLAARIRAFVVEVGPDKASNTAIANMIRREFQIFATPGQVAGLVGRLRLDRAERRIQWTDAMLATLREYRLAEMGWHTIGQRMRLSDTACRQKWSDMGWEAVNSSRFTAHPGTPWTDERKAEFRRRHAAGHTYPEMAEALGSSKSALKQMAARIGLPSRDNRASMQRKNTPVWDRSGGTLEQDADDALDGSTIPDFDHQGRPPVRSTNPIVVVTEPERVPGDNAIIGGWLAGWSASQIAEHTKRTKNAVVGRAHRLIAMGVLEARESPIIRDPERAAKPVAPRVGKASLPPLPPLPSAREDMPLPHPTEPPPEAATVQSPPLLPSTPATPLRAVSALPEWVTRPMPRAKMCLWPAWGHHEAPTHVYCDAPTMVTRDHRGDAKVHVYCAAHHRIAYRRQSLGASVHAVENRHKPLPQAPSQGWHDG